MSKKKNKKTPDRPKSKGKNGSKTPKVGKE